MEQEEWNLGPATANVLRLAACTLIELRGFVTAQAFEALHRRMAMEPAADLRLLIGNGAVLLATNRSLAEAASRGTRATDTRPVTIIVPQERLVWGAYHLIACQHCRLVRQIHPLRRLKEAVFAG